jgi:hypothetical protein
VFWMRSASRVRKREGKVPSLHTLFVLIPLHKPREKILLSPTVKKLPTGQLRTSPMDRVNRPYGVQYCS